jgi:hypothetical protein
MPSEVCSCQSIQFTLDRGGKIDLAWTFWRLYSQSPTLNAVPVIAAALEAARRGVEITLYLDIGFNDAVGPDLSEVCGITRADDSLSVLS